MSMTNPERCSIDPPYLVQGSLTVRVSPLSNST
jgi:hypothetical protein